MCSTYRSECVVQACLAPCHGAVSVPPVPDAANRFRMSAADQRKLTERSSRFKAGLDSANSDKKVSMEDLFKNAVSVCEVCVLGLRML